MQKKTDETDDDEEEDGRPLSTFVLKQKQVEQTANNISSGPNKVKNSVIWCNMETCKRHINDELDFNISMIAGCSWM